MTTLCVLLLTFITAISNAQTIYNQTISNSSGDYFISTSHSPLNDGEIRCTSNIPCQINCAEASSCNNTNIYCNNASKCIIDCSGDESCQHSTFHISTDTTTINCGSLTDDSVSTTCKQSLIYTDYANNPSSTVELTCIDSYACDDMKIQDISTHVSSYTDADIFKIFCYDASIGCDIDDLHEPYPIITPTINNNTGEYYTNIGSYITIKCTHSSLCFIDCSFGGCWESTINCGHAEKCMIQCTGDGTDSCEAMNIIANGNNEFILQCPNTGSGACEDSHIDIKNVNSVSIICGGEGRMKCQRAEFNLGIFTKYCTLFLISLKTFISEIVILHKNT